MMRQRQHTAQVLAMAQCQIGDAGLTQLADAVSESRALRELDLAGNDITDSGVRSQGRGARGGRSCRERAWRMFEPEVLQKLG